jgi:hypothetical protein
MEERFAFVPWGQGEHLRPATDRVLTLIDALSDIYEVIVVVTGKVGMGSSLPLFTGAGAKCLLLANDDSALGDTRSEVASLGFEDLRVIAATGPRSEVA